MWERWKDTKECGWEWNGIVDKAAQWKSEWDSIVLHTRSTAIKLLMQLNNMSASVSLLDALYSHYKTILLQS